MAHNDPSINCKWEFFIINCSTVLNPTYFGLESTNTKEITEINFEKPIYEKYPVLMCFAPMIYKKKKWVKIQEFAYFDFDRSIINNIGFNPMKEILSRNQHLALSDCVMRYRESADFIIIADIDEILFPKENNYFQEFSKWSNLHPTASAFSYLRSYAKIDTPNEFSKFSLSKTLESIRISKSFFMGKSILQTKNVETAWIHWPGLSRGKRITINPKLGRIYHIQTSAEKVRTVKNVIRLGEKENIKNLVLFNPLQKNEIQSINDTFVSTFSNIQNFKDNHIYADIIFECFKKHENWKVFDSCYTPFECKIPSNVSNFECEIQQFGFRNGISTTKQLISYLEHIYAKVSAGETIDVIYFDFVKAFDKVPISKLIKSLKKAGIRVNSARSNLADATSGIAQGSVMGPIYFIIFIAELSKRLDLHILHFLFADDLKIIYSYHINNFDKSVLQNAINDIIKWCDENSMDLSTPKTHHIQFGKPNDAAVYKIKETQIEKTETVRDLGIFISNNLSFSNHIDNIVSNATKKLFSITKKLVTDDKNILIKVFNTYIRPSLEYCSPLFNIQKLKFADQLEAPQRKFTRILYRRIYGFTSNNITLFFSTSSTPVHLELAPHLD
uniref:Glycosyltransferase family 92 protein n=1 Tax=Panagrolaimus davidi TaxID=227884 RepID=A0A914P5N6_9BILA